MSRDLFPSVFLVLIALGSPLTSVRAQESCAGAKGRLTTVEGWVIPGATIRAPNKATRQVASVNTDSSGEYSLCLAPGTYDILATVLGFKPAKRKSIRVDNSMAIIDFTMKRGKPIIVDEAHP